MRGISSWPPSRNSITRSPDPPPPLLPLQEKHSAPTHSAPTKTLVRRISHPTFASGPTLRIAICFLPVGPCLRVLEFYPVMHRGARSCGARSCEVAFALAGCIANNGPRLFLERWENWQLDSRMLMQQPRKDGEQTIHGCRTLRGRSNHCDAQRGPCRPRTDRGSRAQSGPRRSRTRQLRRIARNSSRTALQAAQEKGRRSIAERRLRGMRRPASPAWVGSFCWGG